MKNSTTGIVLAAILLGGIGWWFCGAKGAAAEAVLPVEKAKLSLVRGLYARARAAWHRTEVAEENLRLKREVALLAQVRGENERVMAENLRLRQLLNYDPPVGGNWIVAPVLSHGGTAGVMHMLKVGRGSADGIAANDTVAVPDGLVGRVISTSPHTAEVLLLTDPTSKVACELKPNDGSSGRIFGIVSGTESILADGSTALALLYAMNPLLIRHLETEMDLPPRTRVVTSGRGGIFPPGLTVGYLLRARVDSTGLEREGDVTPAVDFAGLEDVLIRHEK